MRRPERQSGAPQRYIIRGEVKEGEALAFNGWFIGHALTKARGEIGRRLSVSIFATERDQLIVQVSRLRWQTSDKRVFNATDQKDLRAALAWLGDGPISAEAWRQACQNWDQLYFSKDARQGSCVRKAVAQ